MRFHEIYIISCFRKLNILALDGGGSRGVMEAMILDDVMRLVTMMIYNPDRYLPQTIANFWRNPCQIGPENLTTFRQLLEEKLIEDKLIHPTQIFDMIAGTSTGSLIAYALVAGEINTSDDIESLRTNKDIMSVTSIIEMYRQATKNIFENQGRGTVSEVTWWSDPIRWLTEQYKSMDLKKSFAAITGYRRSQDGLKDELKKKFGEYTLGHMRPSERNNHCIASAVATKLSNDKKEPGKLEIFDTANVNQQHLSIHEVLMASCDAPRYFKTPVQIGEDEYVDGGVGGNCPLTKAIPRALEIDSYESSHIETVISIAPPPPVSFGNLKFRFNVWGAFQYAISSLTDGLKIYEDCKKFNEVYLGPSKAAFLRATPVSNAAQKFPMDEVNVKGMEEAIENERINKPEYYNQILDISALTVSRWKKFDLTEDFLVMMDAVVENLRFRRQYDIHNHVCKSILERIQERLERIQEGNISPNGLSQKGGKLFPLFYSK